MLQRGRLRHGRPAMPPCFPSVAFTLHIRHTVTSTLSEPANMPSKPNYKYQRTERDRAKKASKDTKLQEREEQASLRRASEPDRADPCERSNQGSGE